MSNLRETFVKAMTEAREEGINEEEIYRVVAERMQEDACREIVQFVDQIKWGRIDAVNKSHFDLIRT